MASNQIIDPSAISRTEIHAALRTFLEGQSDADSWKDYFSMGAGTTVLELCSVLGTFLKYNSLTAKRESSILTARLKSVIYGIADTLAYPINRSKAVRMRLTINVSSAIYWSRENPIGYLNGQALSLLDSVYLSQGQQKINVVLGEWKELSQTTTTIKDFSSYDFPIANIDLVDNELLEVYINNGKVSYSRYMEDIYEGKLIIKTLLDTLSLVSGDDSIGYKIRVGDLLNIKYIEISESQLQDTSTYQISNVKITPSEVQPLALEVTSVYAQQDSLEKIVALAPAYHSTSRKLISPSDHEALVRSFVGMRDASFNRGFCTISDVYDPNSPNKRICEENGGVWVEGKVGCCTNGMSYLFEDEHIMLEEEEVALMDYLDPFRIPPSGIIYRDPQPVLVHPEIIIVITKDADTQQITADTRQYLLSKTLKLKGLFHVGDLHKFITNRTGVVRAYIRKPTSDRSLLFYQYFKLGDLNIRFANESDIISYEPPTDTGYS